MTLRIAAWAETFETAESRKLKRLTWVSVPNKTDGDGYTALVDHPNGVAHLGAWYAIVEAASKQTPRGQLPGIPPTLEGICQSLRRMSRLPAEVFAEVIPRLIEIGWIAEVLSNQQTLTNLPASARVPAESAGVSGESARVPGIHNKTVHNRTLQDTHIARAPIVADLDGIVSPRFDEFWLRYPRKQHRTEAAGAWISMVHTGNDTAVLLCLDRYLASDEVARGVVQNPDKWLFEQGRSGWSGSWPARQQVERKLSKAESVAERGRELFRQGMAKNGTRTR